jgi:hypothetical protein
VAPCPLDLLQQVREVRQHRNVVLVRPEPVIEVLFENGCLGGVR